MAIMMKMNWLGIKPEQYDSLHESVNWEGNKPDGALFHVSAFDDKGIHVIDLWDTAEQFDNFAKNRLIPEVQKLGITSQPDVQILPVHAIYTPAYTKK